MLSGATAARTTDPATRVAANGGCQGIREILDRVGDKWSLQIVGALSEGPLRFNEIRRRITGISQRMLTRTLRFLERDGLVTRSVFATVPPSVEYALSPLGITLIDPVRVLAQWAVEHQSDIGTARANYDAANQPDRRPVT